MSDEPLLAGVELGGTKCIAVLARGATIVAREQVATTTPDDTLRPLRAVLDRWSERQGFAALGIASFGLLDLDCASVAYGTITETAKPGWAGTRVLDRLGRGLGVPSGFATDVAGAALAEGHWGAAQGCDTHCYITVGTGVGVGIVAGGRPLQGVTHPEAGHVRIRRTPGDEFAGTCVFHGDCLEGLVAGPAIAARTGQASATLADDHPVWDRVAAEIAELLAMLVLTLAPQRIVLGGGVPQRRPQLVQLVRTRTATLLGAYQPNHRRDAIDALIVAPGLGDDAGPLGGIRLAALALDRGTLLDP